MMKKAVSENEEDVSYTRRLYQYKNGGIVIMEDIVNQSLKSEDFINEDLLLNSFKSDPE